ncbi:MAG: hypothetical protein HYX86_03890 [Chloroflexi bacterium]|nr:hypothetical protein [Chloroflexota bacterium]
MKWFSPKVLGPGIALPIIVTLLLASLAWAGHGGRYTFFGGTNLITGGVDNYWAMELVSNTADESTANDFSGVDFAPKPTQSITFSDLYRLSAWYDVTDDDCGGGSPRFQINLDVDGDGVFTGFWEGGNDGNLFVYIGPYPNFTDCEPGWQYSGNLIEATDLRYDLTHFGGPFYGSYEDAVQLVGDYRVLGIQLVVDAGWFFEDGEQTVLGDDIRINQFRFKGHPM